MVLRIGVDACIGCGVCMEVCPDIFALDEEEGKGTVLKSNYDDDKGDCIREAIEFCPVGCITE